MKTTDPEYIKFNEGFPSHSLMFYVGITLDYLTRDGNQGFAKMQAHFDDPDDFESLPPVRRFRELLRLLENQNQVYSHDKPDFWTPGYPGYETLIRVREYVRRFD